MGKYLKMKFVPKYPKKYLGDITNIIARSSWEVRMMKFLDENASILNWSSEELAIPYVSPIDGKVHRYFPDFMIKYKTKVEEIKLALIEIKPKKECIPPKHKRNTKKLLEEQKTYAVNQAKWNAAEQWAKKKNMDFLVLTEDHLFSGSN